jgi:tetratricopeptide (TPR) repeat protein
MQDFVAAEIARYEQGLAEARANCDRQAESRNLYELASLYCWRTEDGVDHAIELHRQGLAIAHEIGDKSLQAMHLAGLGECYGLSWHDKGDSETARDYFERALALAREIGDRKSESGYLSSIGHMCAALRDYARALECYQGALALARETGDNGNEANQLHNIGVAFRNLMDYPQAIDSIQQAIAVWQAMDGREIEQYQIAKRLADLVDIYCDMGDYQQARDHYERGLALATSLNREGLLHHYAHLSNRIANVFSRTDSDAHRTEP